MISTVQLGSSLGSCPTFPNTYYNWPSGHWPCVESYLVGGSDKYLDGHRAADKICGSDGDHSHFEGYGFSYLLQDKKKGKMISFRNFTLADQFWYPEWNFLNINKIPFLNRKYINLLLLSSVSLINYKGNIISSLIQNYHCQPDGLSIYRENSFKLILIF